METDDTTLITEWIEGSEIVLDNIPMKVNQLIGYQLSNIYAAPQRQGEPGPADHPYNSTYTQRTWVSGQLVRDSQETSDIGKYWDAHAWTQSRGALGHALKVVPIPLPDDMPPGAVTPLARMGQRFYWAIGTTASRIMEFVEETVTLRNPGGLTDVEVQGSVTNTGVAFRVNAAGDNDTRTELYIPTSGGYTRLGDDFSVQHAPAEMAWSTVGFCVHENKLYRLTTSGAIFTILEHDDDWIYVATIPDGSEPRNIYRDYDDANERVVAVTTSTGLWLLDHDNGIFFETDFTYPENAYQGYGAAPWRGGSYVSVGVGLHRRNPGLIDATGLDDKDGLPRQFAGGFITDLEPSYNWLIAAVAGEVHGGSPAPFNQEEVTGMTSSIPYPIVGHGTSAHFLGINRMGAIFAQNGLGWMELYRWNRPPTRVVVSRTMNVAFSELAQNLFFGDVDGHAFMIRIPATYYNPLMSPNLPLDRTSWLESSRIDWNTPDTPKLAKQFNIKPDHLAQWLTEDKTLPIDFFNRIQIILNWIDLTGNTYRSDDPAVMNGPGPYPFSDGDIILPYLELPPRTIATSIQANGRYSASVGWERYRDTGVLLATGLPHEAIWPTFRFIGDGSDPGDVPHPLIDYAGGIIQWWTIVARKWMRPNRVWTAQIDVSNAIKGVSEQDTLRILDTICFKVGGVPFVHGDRFYIVDVTRNDGSDPAGLAVQGYRTLTLLEFTDRTYEALADMPGRLP